MHGWGRNRLLLFLLFPLLLVAVVGRFGFLRKLHRTPLIFIGSLVQETNHGLMIMTMIVDHESADGGFWR